MLSCENLIKLIQSRTLKYPKSWELFNGVYTEEEKFLIVATFCKIEGYNNKIKELFPTIYKFFVPRYDIINQLSAIDAWVFIAFYNGSCPHGEMAENYQVIRDACTDINFDLNSDFLKICYKNPTAKIHSDIFQKFVK